MKRSVKRASAIVPQQNLDSFLDIMTNTVGVLMFIGLFMTLVTVESANIIRTPLAKPTKKIARLFEIRGDRLHYVDTEQVQLELERQFKTLVPCQEPPKPTGPNAATYEAYLTQLNNYQNCLAQQGQKLQTLSLDTQDYQVSIVNLKNLSLQYTLKPEQTPPTPQAQTEAYQKQLANFDPRRDYLAFLVRPDGFQGFRQARELAWKQGFDVGWEPISPDTPIVLGNEGRSIGVQ